MISILLDNRIELKAEVFSFSGGERHVKIKRVLSNLNREESLDGLYPPAEVKVTANLTSADEIMDLLLVKDAIDRLLVFRMAEKVLYLPYIPYARQDRVMTNGESLSAAVMGRLINSCEFDMVVVCDPHSDVAPSHIKNVFVIDQSTIFSEVMGKINKSDIIVAPDAGAFKKASKIASQYGCELATGEKTRDPATGWITGTSLHGASVYQRDVIMVDDICDGGMTFIKLAEELVLQGASRVDLYVTHGIFSKGIDGVFNDKIDNIFAAHVWDKYIDGKNTCGKLKILPGTNVFK